MNKELLFQHNLSQRMVAEQLQIKEPYVSNYIRGKGRVPRADWQKIHEFFLELRMSE